MPAGYNPPVNLSSPPPIGNTTPNTVAGTTASFASGTFTVDASGNVVAAKLNTVSGGVTSAVDIVWPASRYIFNGNIFISGTSAGTGTMQVFDNTLTAPAFILGKLQTAAAATTGLTPGVLAATTNATIVIYDSSGTAYRIPCITP